MLEEEFIEVNISGNIKYYENLGYPIPKYKDDHYRWKVKRGTKILVKIKDIPHNSTIKIPVRCDYCGEIYHPQILNYYIGHKTINKDSCNNCKNIKTQEIYQSKYGTVSIKIRSEIEGFKIGRNKIKEDIILNEFYKRNLIPIFNYEIDYINGENILSYICPKHEDKGIQYISYNSLRNTIFGCEYCANEARNEAKRYSFEFVKHKFIEKNYNLISKDYKNVDEELEFVCNKHLEEGIQYTTFWHVLDSINNCKKCRYEMQSGELHYNWQGGISSERDKIMITKEYKEWRNKVYQKDNYTCQCCGDNKGGNLNAHHIKNFSNYPELRLDINNGITLCENCHHPNKYGSFHHIYGTKNNTKEQLEEYIQRYKLGEFDDLRKKIS